MLAVIVLLAFVTEVSAASSWIGTSSYVKYDQLFAWNGSSKTESMIWNITALSKGLAELRITSYSYNVTNGQVNVFPVKDVWNVNTDTRNITESSTGVTGLKNPFWIETGVSVGSTVDAYFGTTAVIQGPETIQVLGQNVSCWTVSLTWPGSTMQRWYDPATGIVLRIDTTTYLPSSQGGINMNVRETAVASNIASIGRVSAEGPKGLALWPYIGGLALLAAGSIVATLAYLYRRSRR